MSNKKWLLYTGDALAVVVLTLIGFASHDELALAYLPRMAATFFPVVIAWLGIAPWLGLFADNLAFKQNLHLRITFAALYASAMAAFLQSLILQTDEVAVGFLFGLAGAAVVSMNIWRWLYVRFIVGTSTTK